jgi:ParB/RepB/Spo0J family partition protein
VIPSREFPQQPTEENTTMAVKLPEYTNQRVKMAQVQVDPDLNSRKGELNEKSIAELAADIKTNGPIHPPVLIPATQAGGKYAKEALSKPFVLVAGFRRMAAYERLGVEAADFRVGPDTMGLKEALAVNLSENLAREDLTAYEIAMQCRRLRDDYKMTAADIGKAVRAHAGDASTNKALSEGFVNNLIRCTTLHPEIVTEWKNGNAAASLRTLIDLAAIKGEAKQLHAWKVATGEIEEEGDDTGGEGDGAGEGSTSSKRPSARKVERAMEHLKTMDVSDEYKAGALAAFKFANGVNKSFGGQKFDAREKAPKEEGAEAGE